MTENSPRIVWQRGRMLAVAAVSCAAVAAALVACSSGGGTPAHRPTSTGSSSPAGFHGNGQAGAGAPAASGQIAARTGSTLQVQNATQGQVAVTFTAKTAISQTVAAQLSSVKVGSCVFALGAAKAGASSTASAAPTAFTAATIAITPATGGSCVRGGGFTGGGGFGRSGGSFPSGHVPSNFPSGHSFPSGFGSGHAFPGGGRAGSGTTPSGFASGQVTAVTATTISVKSTGFGNQSARTVVVTVGSSTKLTRQVTATASALKVGQCVSATGKAGSTGTVAATRLAVTAPTSSGCTVGFNRFGGGGSG